MAVLTRLLLSLAPLAFATVAIAFAIKATIDKDWAQRAQFDTTTTPLEVNWTHPNFTEYRSPFILCGFQEQNLTAQGPDDLGSNVTYTCQSWLPFGNNRTSCEPLSEVLVSVDARYGDARRCQQTHWAGNLAIASTSFIGLGFLITFTMAFIAVLAIILPAVVNESEPQTSDETQQQDTKTGISTASHPHRPKNTYRRPHERYLSPTAPYLNVVLIFSFSFGAILFVFAQFYGVEAFVQSAPDNGAYAASGGTQQLNIASGSFAHTPWVQGKAISVYASVAWVFAALTAITAGIVWRVPRLAVKSPL